MADAPKQKAQEKTSQRRRLLTPLGVLGWVLGAFSVLHLIEDLSIVRIVGLLKKWLDAYSAVVLAVNETLFGWIAIGWIGISEAETHFIFLAWLIGAAYARAFTLKRETASLEHWSVSPLTVLVCALIYSAFAFVPALLLPGVWGSGGAAFGAGLIAGFLVLRDERRIEGSPSTMEVLRELLGIAAVTLILLAANYSLSQALADRT